VVENPQWQAGRGLCDHREEGGAAGGFMEELGAAIAAVEDVVTVVGCEDALDT
jgi:hypothetical protein